MKINWKVRLRNKTFWITLVPAVLVLLQYVSALFGYRLEIKDVSNQLIDIVNALFVVLSIVGVVNDPSTHSLNDTKLVMEYDEPRKEVN